MSPIDRPRQWRAMAEDPDRLVREFPALAGALQRPESRRHVLRLMAASMALGGLAGCDPSMPDGHYTPAVKQPPDIVPGIANHYSSASLAAGDVAGIVVTHRMGRPIKIEGNPRHPASLGATDVHGQALLLDFYDPDRAAGVLQGGQIAGWAHFRQAASAQRARWDRDHGAGLRILTGRVVSPTLRRTLGRMLQRYPASRWHQWEAVSRHQVAQGAALAYGRTVDVLPKVDAADVILALDSDLISTAPGHLRHARHFASRRNPVRARMSRVYAAEPSPTLIGASADHRFVAGVAEMQAGLQCIAAAILDGQAIDGPRWAPPVAAALKAAGPRALVHAGPDLPAEAQALVYLINERLGARGTTFDVINPIGDRPDPGDADLAALVADMQAGQVDSLVILDGNPVYGAPGFSDALRRVPFSVSSASSADETGRATTWYVPQTHGFESWADARAFDGTATIIQPQSLPLYGGHSAVSLLSQLIDDVPEDSASAVRETWRDRLDDAGWTDALASGVVAGTAEAPITAPPVAARPRLPDIATGPHLLLRPDANLWDGRYSNNPWLQELPRPLTKLVWDNPLLIAPAMAKHLRITSGDVVRLSIADRQVTAPVWIMPGQADDVIVALMGGGRWAAGGVGNAVGTDMTPLRGAPGTPALHPTGHKTRLASTDHHNVLEVEREEVDEVVRHGTLAAFQANPDFLHVSGKTNETIYDRKPTGQVAWGMSVDLNACIGCNACVIACQAENNVPVVGKDQVLLGREMHWLRIDRYYEGPAEAPESYFQPMLCMHCEQAPCEPVCPVEASIHDSEGLNLQVYNRCIGTRFCSNNCPYKVRRFNFGAWAREEHRPPISRNPDVSVRARGVMEKCTFCVQRIAEARIAHDRDGTPEQVVTACQAACPTQAFTFGDINDANSTVSAHKRSPLDYALLAEQNTHPRLTYEARIANRDPGVAS